MKTIKVTEETHKALVEASLMKESFSETIDRLLGNMAGIRGLIPADDAAMEFFGDEHRRLGNSSAASTLTQLFVELQQRRKAAKEACGA